MVRRDSAAIEMLRAWIGCVVGACICSTADAQIVWHGSLGITSDYVQAGLSQTRGEAAVQGGVRADFGPRWSIGVWGSQIDRNPGPGATHEIDAYLSHAWQLSPDWVATLTATHYFYPNDIAYLRYDYDDVSAAIGYRSKVFATLVWSPNTSDGGPAWVGRREHTWAYELTVTQPLINAWSCNAGVGHRDMTALAGPSYWYGHAGISYSSNALSVHLSYARADSTAQRYFGNERAANTLIGAVIWKIGGG